MHTPISAARRTKLGAAAFAAALPFALAAAPAQACGGCDDSDISVRVSDRTPASGQQFVARGLFILGGLPAPGHVVKVQTYRGGDWVNITGARVTTNDEGRYRVRLILFAKGERLMRVKGIGEQNEKNEVARFTVRVH